MICAARLIFCVKNVNPKPAQTRKDQSLMDTNHVSSGNINPKGPGALGVLTTSVLDVAAEAAMRLFFVFVFLFFLFFCFLHLGKFFYYE